MRVLFLGSPGRFSACALWACMSVGLEICEFWYSHRLGSRAWREDRHLGWFNPSWSVSAALKRFSIPSRAVTPLRSAPSLWKADEFRADAVVSAEFPYLVPMEMLAKLGGRAANLHPSLLPDYGGPLPVLWMLFREDVRRCGGVTLHEMTPELDSGPLIAQQRVPWDSGGFRNWEADLCLAAGKLVRNHLRPYLQGAIATRPQAINRSTYFRSMDRSLMTIGSQLPADRVRHLLDSIGSYAALQARVGERLVKVSRFQGIVSPRPTKEPPSVGPVHIEMDVADARIVLQRWLPGTSKVRRWQTFRLFASDARSAYVH